MIVPPGEYTLLQKKCTLISSRSPSDPGSLTLTRVMSSLSNSLGSNMQKTPFENSLQFSCTPKSAKELFYVDMVSFASYSQDQLTKVK